MGTKLSDLVRMRIAKIPRDAIPELLGEVEVIKARLWARLMQIEMSKNSLRVEDVRNEIRGFIGVRMPKI